MSTQTVEPRLDEGMRLARVTPAARFDPSPVNVRVKISALWTAMLFVFAYVDLFSLYRGDVRAELAAGGLGGFTVGEPFLLGTTIYVAIPALMVFASLVLRPRLNRFANTGLPAAYALTIVAGALGEWSYWIVGSAIEVVLLGAISHQALTWPRTTQR